jgi:hypothetical protein
LKKLNFLLVFLICFYFGIPFVEVKGQEELPIKESIFLYSDRFSEQYGKQYNVYGLAKGDVVSWKFTTYDDPFEVGFYIEGYIYSLGKTSDSGSVEILRTVNLMIFYFSNQDEFNDGWIDIEIRKRIAIHGFNFFFTIGCVGFVIFIFMMQKLCKIQVTYRTD